MKVLCIGHASWDITIPVDDYPTENFKYRFNEKVSGGGGPASNAAFLLGKWGVDTVLSAVVGSDDFGTNIKKELQDVNVNTTFIETNYDKDTSLSFVIINRKNGSRTVFNVANERPMLKKLNYDFTPDIILTDGHDYGASQNAISKYNNAISVLDAGRKTPEVLELCKYVNYIVCSKSFAEELSGMTVDYNNPSTLVNIYTKIQNKYPNSNIVVTLEEHGCLYQSGKEIKIMPGLKEEAVDTTGAGDIFHGAFVYGLANNFDIDKNVTIANIAAGLSIKKIGSRNSCPSLSETLEYYAKKTGANVSSGNQGGTPQITQTPVPQPSEQPVVEQTQPQTEPSKVKINPYQGM